MELYPGTQFNQLLLLLSCFCFFFFLIGRHVFYSLSLLPRGPRPAQRKSHAKPDVIIAFIRLEVQSGMSFISKILLYRARAIARVFGNLTFIRVTLDANNASELL